jgi:hypothetical protein
VLFSTPNNKTTAVLEHLVSEQLVDFNTPFDLEKVEKQRVFSRSVRRVLVRRIAFVARFFDFAHVARAENLVACARSRA